VAALSTVGELITRARVLLQDEVAPYRYDTPELIASLNEACMEAKRLRPDLWLRTLELSMPVFTAESDTVTEAKIPSEYRPTFIYYVVGNAQLRDEEDSQNRYGQNVVARATIFLTKFTTQLLQIPS